MGHLTKTFIDKLTPPEKGHDTYWDDDPRSLGLRIMASGHKSFIVHKRFRGRPITYTIGPFGELAVEEARDEARDVLRNIRHGIDPRKARKEERARGITLRQLADEYISRPGKLKESSKDQYDRHPRTTFKDMEHRPVIEIDEDYCRSLYRKMRKGGLHGTRKNGSPGSANQGMRTLKALINYGMRVHKLPFGTNPVDAITDDWVNLRPRESFISASRMGHVWNYLVAQQAVAYNRADLSGIELAMFMVLSGCRISEAKQLQWSNVNLDEAWWHIADPKNRRPIWLPLSTQAVKLLEQRPRVRDNPHVFPGRERFGHIEDPRSVWLRISKITGEKIRSHDCRRTLVTNGFAELGIDFHKLELLSGHKLPGVTAAHYLSTKRLQYLAPELQKYADWIESQAAKASGSNVVALRA